MNLDFGINQSVVEELYLRYLENRHAVDEQWRGFFDRLSETGEAVALAGNGTASVAASTNGNGTSYPSSNGNGTAHTSASTASSVVIPRLSPLTSLSIPPDAGRIVDTASVEGRAIALIHAYRSRGHLFADLDPLGLTPKPPEELTLQTFGLTERDLASEVSGGDLSGVTRAPLREIVARCEETYTRHIGTEFMQLESREERLWLQEKMETTLNRRTLTPAIQRRILTKLTDAEIFEQFLHTNFLGAKRFSCEGTESMIPMVDLLIDESGAYNVEEIVIGMAHRGRLTVLANIMHKPVKEIFAGFEDKHPEANMGRGDVKYHMGYSSDVTTTSGQQIHLSLAFNPSHLEFVNAVVEGRVRAKQDRRGDNNRKRVVPILLHGDAAFMGQGIVAETLNMSGLEGYNTGGTIHVVINNQVGFTTSPSDSRSTRYATDITRMLKIPVFHVNGEDPEAVAQVVHLALAYRQRFGRDVCIDLLGYRKYGHNEGDEPRFTQPLMYAAIDRKPSVRKVYIQHLVAMGSITEQEADSIASSRKAALEAELAESRQHSKPVKISAFSGLWAKYQTGTDAETADVETKISTDTVYGLFDKLAELPNGFKAHKNVAKIWPDRLRMAREPGRGLDWGAGEALAFASLLNDGVSIRLSGQDARRGTFSHRHSVITDQSTGVCYCPYGSVAKNGARFDVFDSPLSEAGVMGFDYGYSLDYPDGLVIWEAQFGDFANGAQVIIDQFLSAAEDKWERCSGLVLLLPHGFEGAGPEHSSARLERFLQNCAEDNMYVVNMTTSAQLFHVLRRQLHRPLRKPLVVMSPKSLLRQAFAPLSAFTEGRFQRVIPDTGVVEVKDGALTIDPAQVERIVICSGKVFYELEAERIARKNNKVAIVRLEQLYPLSAREIQNALGKYGTSVPVVWVQDEPWNMGAWYYLQARLPALLAGRRLACVARPESASPATGSGASHKVEQQILLREAFDKPV